jgi:hypothetical protein
MASVIGRSFDGARLTASVRSILAGMFDHGALHLVADALRLAAQAIELLHQRAQFVWGDRHAGIMVTITARIQLMSFEPRDWRLFRRGQRGTSSSRRRTGHSLLHSEQHHSSSTLAPWIVC